MKIRSQIYKNYQYVAVADIHTCNDRQLRPFSINNNASNIVSAGEHAKCLSRTVRRHRRSCMILRTLFHCPCKTSVALAGLWHASVCIDCNGCRRSGRLLPGGCRSIRRTVTAAGLAIKSGPAVATGVCRTAQLFHRPSYAWKQYRSMRQFCNPPLLTGCRAAIHGRPVGAVAEGDSALVPAYLEILRNSPALRNFRSDVRTGAYR